MIMTTADTFRLALPLDAITAFCQHWGITEFAVFGSALRDDFRPDSDIDVLVTFRPESKQSLADILDMEEELQALFGRKVDLVDSQAVIHSPNYIRRNEILRTATVIYAA
jgi:predicted nucleotidyltransferase